MPLCLVLVLERDGACIFCGTTEDLEVDHIIPVAAGGKTTLENCRVLCGECHRRAHKLARMSPS